MVQIQICGKDGKQIGTATLMQNKWLVELPSNDYVIDDINDLRTFSRRCHHPELAATADLIMRNIERNEKLQALSDVPNKIKDAIEFCMEQSTSRPYQAAIQEMCRGSFADLGAGIGMLVIFASFLVPQIRRHLNI